MRLSLLLSMFCLSDFKTPNYVHMLKDNTLLQYTFPSLNENTHLPRLYNKREGRTLYVCTYAQVYIQAGAQSDRHLIMS